MLHFNSIWKLYWININGFIGVPKWSGFRGTCLIIYFKLRLWVPRFLTKLINRRDSQLIRSKTKTNYDYPSLWMLMSSPKVFKNRVNWLFWARGNSCKRCWEIYIIVQILKLQKTRTYYFPSLYFKVLFYSGLENPFPFLHFYEKRWIFRMMKYKNGIRKLTEKHSTNKELFLAGARASHQQR